MLQFTPTAALLLTLFLLALSQSAATAGAGAGAGAGAEVVQRGRGHNAVLLNYHKTGHNMVEMWANVLVDPPRYQTADHRGPHV